MDILKILTDLEKRLSNVEQTQVKHIESTLVIAEKQHDNTGMIYKDKQILRDNIKNIKKLTEM